MIESKTFALRIIRLYKFLNEEKDVRILSKQLLRSGTSIGANVRESVNAQSKMDFINKLNIALKEANETDYWLKKLLSGDYITPNQYQSMHQDNEEIIKILVSIIKTCKNE